MTFEEFWEKNYAKDFGDCEPYYGIASHAFEAGQKNCDCVHTDNSAVIERLQNENEQLKKQYEFLSNQICNKECVEVWGESDKLKEQIEKMKCCGNCQTVCDVNGGCYLNKDGRCNPKDKKQWVMNQ